MYVQLLSLGNIGNMGLAWQGMGWSIARPRWHVVAWDCPSPTPRALSSPFIPYAHALCPWTNAAAKEDGQWTNEVWPWAKLGWPASRRRVGGNLGNNNTSLPNRRLAWFASSRSSFFFHLHSLQACSHPRRHPSSRRSVVRSIDRSLARSLVHSLENHPSSPSLSDAHLCTIEPAFLALLQYEVRSLLPSDESHRGRAFAFEGPSRAAPALSPCTVQRPSPVLSCPPIRHPSPVGPLGRTLLSFNLTTNLSPNQRPPFCAFDLA
ncbi:hypothetical protein EDB80DRAFT_674300 [Ilyonectria destructans]|nr:hypothetical protein EDB80DRAFT_674300 [Ilyonectria destructans]